MMLRFINPREPQSPQDLTTLEQAQLLHASLMYDGESYTIEERFGDREGVSFLGFLTLWDVVDEDDQPIFTFFDYMVDSGAFFHANTMDPAAEVIQFWLDQARSPEIYEQIASALQHARANDLPHPRVRFDLDDKS